MGEPWQTFLIIAGLVVVAFAIPPKFDPAMRLKKWLERKDCRHDK